MFGLGLLEKVVDGVSTYFNNKQKEKLEEKRHKAKIEELTRAADVEVAKGNAQAKIEMAKTGQVQDYNLDNIAMKQMEKSWKDEIILIVFLAPMIMAFVPGAQELALKGFHYINQMPEWYVYIIIGMVVVIYGMRGMLKWILTRKG